MHPALHACKLPGDQVQCLLCPHACILAPGRSGLCGVRRNDGGELTSLNYGKAVAVHVDPIEKKPLYHLYPGSRSLSVAAAGCNFHCRFCQNHEISQIKGGSGTVPGRPVTPRQLVDQALADDCRTISCTYTEPTVFYEYALEICRLAREQGIDTVWVTNGYISEAPLRELAPFLTAANVDLKGWNDEFYRSVIGGTLQPVLDTLRLMKELGIWVEVTTLIIPGQVDGEDELGEIARFICKELGAETPWHISRFYPQYRFTEVSPTPLAVLQRARQIGLTAGLRYVYTGNVPGEIGENSYCHRCGALLIGRYGFQIVANNLQAGSCPACGTGMDGLFIKEEM